MRTVVTSALALALMTGGALAADPAKPASKPVKLTEAQMDNVTAGQPCSVISCIDVTVDVRNNEILKDINVAAAVPVNAAVNVLGGPTAAGQGVIFRPTQ